MDQNLAMLGGLAIGIYAVVLFFVFSYNIGALGAFGRRPLENKKFFCLSLGAVVPAVGCLGSLYLTTVPLMLDQPSLLAVTMASIGLVCRHAFLKMEQYLARSGL